MATDGADGADEVVRLERELLGTASRQSAERLAELLDPGFFELGASGRRWSRAETIAALVEAELPLDAVLLRPEAIALAPGVLLLTYEAEVEGRSSLRSSIWVQRDDGGWRLRFQQGTLRSPGAAGPRSIRKG